MKVVFIFSLLLLAALLHESDARFFRRLGRRLKTAARKVTSGVKDAAGSVRRALEKGVDRARDSAVGTIDRVRDRVTGALGKLFRGKRSAITFNRMDDVNAVDIATTFNLDLPGVQNVFVLCDVDDNGSLKGKEVLAFLGMIEDLAAVSNHQSPPKH